MKNLFLVVLLSFCLCGCCVNSVNIKPEMNTFDVKNAKIGVVKGDIDFIFKDCCSGQDKKQLVLSVKKKTEKLFKQLMSGEISTDEYNEKVDDIHKGLSFVVYACAAARGENSSLIGANALSLDDAWTNLMQIEQSIE